jgi:hypothetical protein
MRMQNEENQSPLTRQTASAVSLLRAPRPWTSHMIIEALLSYFILFSIAPGYFYNFVMHVFLGEMTAPFIGWEGSPFQSGVGRYLWFCSCRLSRVPRELQHAHCRRCGSRVLPAWRGRHSCPENADSPQLCARECGGHLLYRYLLPVIGFTLLWPTHWCSRRNYTKGC